MMKKNKKNIKENNKTNDKIVTVILVILIAALLGVAVSYGIFRKVNGNKLNIRNVKITKTIKIQ